MEEQDIAMGCGLLIVLGLCFFMFGSSFITLNIKNRANGTHTGYITAVEDITSPFDGAANGTRIYVKTDLSSSQEDKYCVSDSNQDLIQKLRDASKSRSNVSITFDNYSWTGFNNCSGDIITNVEEIK